MPAAAGRYLVRVARTVAAGVPIASVGAPDPSLDLPLLLHLASTHHLKRATLDALVAYPDAIDDIGAPDGLTRRDLDASRAALAVGMLATISQIRRAQTLLAGAAIDSVVAPSPAIALMTAGRTLVDPDRLALVVAADDVSRADTLLALEPAGHRVPIQSMPDGCDLRHEAMTLPPGFGELRVPSRADQLQVLAAGDSQTSSMAHLVARAALTADAAALITECETRLNGSPIHPHARRPGPDGQREVWVAGFPSLYGGADTELDHLIDLLRMQGVAVHLVPMFDADATMRDSAIARGCQIHEYRDDVFADKVVVSFCNGGFLEKLPTIAEAGRPAQVIWFNCMTWTFEAERRAHRAGLLDRFGFQSQYQRNALLPWLEPDGPVRTFFYRPYFNPRRVEWRYRDWNGAYRVGRISRDDQRKFAADTWNLFARVRVPPPLTREVVVLGYGPNAETRIGPPPDGLACTLWAPNSVPATTFYRTIDTMIHKTGGSRESSSRVLFEAYAHGVVPIVERDFAFPELVIQGETGFMGSSTEEMSEYASLLAHDPALHRRMAENGRTHLEAQYGNAAGCWEPWQPVLGLRT